VNGTVLLDTNVFTARLRKDRPLEAQYAKHVFGKRVVIAPQTIAEARYGALKAGWGPRRLNELADTVARVRMLPVDLDLIEAVVTVRNQCRLMGHALHQRGHNADLWIAGSAIHWRLPLVAHDAVFVGCPGLDLRTQLAG
jgi:predicted nucleic acid-binding protein